MPSSAPTLSGLHFALTIGENAAPQLLDSDGDVDGNFSGGSLTVSGKIADPASENVSPGGF